MRKSRTSGVRSRRSGCPSPGARRAGDRGARTARCRRSAPAPTRPGGSAPGPSRTAPRSRPGATGPPDTAGRLDARAVRSGRRSRSSGSPRTRRKGCSITGRNSTCVNPCSIDVSHQLRGQVAVGASASPRGQVHLVDRHRQRRVLTGGRPARLQPVRRPATHATRRRSARRSPASVSVWNATGSAFTRHTPSAHSTRYLYRSHCPAPSAKPCQQPVQSSRFSSVARSGSQSWKSPCHLHPLRVRRPHREARAARLGVGAEPVPEAEPAAQAASPADSSRLPSGIAIGRCRDRHSSSGPAGTAGAPSTAAAYAAAVCSPTVGQP